MNMNWHLIKKLCLIPITCLLLAIIGDVLIFSLVEYGRKSTEFVGCYAYDAMLVGFECQGFAASGLVSVWLNWPLWLLWGPMFALFSFRAFAVAVLVWLPLILYVLSIIKLRKIQNA
jgi:hypothetical protein